MDSNKIEIENKDQELKRLGFVRVIAISALVCVSNLYENAKQYSGSLKSTVGTVESAVTTVVGPVYEKFKGVPGDLLVFLDEKVDEATNKFDECTPPSAKWVASKAHCMVQKASEVAQTLVQEAQVGGPCAAAHYAGNLGMQVFWSAIVRLWYVTNLFPILHILAQMAIPTMAHWSEKYNKTLVELSAKGYTSFSHFPEIPINELVKAYKQFEEEKGPACAPCAADKETQMN
ncbi:rubber elongation factor protein [Actinidia rufa]|uniref:Rubber elongation factor protein n=1 Tax=Actinidia rufa TaxID=165716 RepID=A0A7J0EPA9_9ERIC|nr:rubber elongation factor protein [Actinidia rufa]